MRNPFKEAVYENLTRFGFSRNFVNKNLHITDRTVKFEDKTYPAYEPNPASAEEITRRLLPFLHNKTVLQDGFGGTLAALFALGLHHSPVPPGVLWITHTGPEGELYTFWRIPDTLWSVALLKSSHVIVKLSGPETKAPGSPKKLHYIKELSRGVFPEVRYLLGSRLGPWLEDNYGQSLENHTFEFRDGLAFFYPRPKVRRLFA